MAWGEMTSEQIATKLKEAGFDTAQINQKLKTLDGVASKEEVKAIADSVANTQATLAQLENTLRESMGKPKTEPQNTDDGKPKGPFTVDPLQFMEDPTNAVRQIINAEVGPMAIHTLTMSAEMAYNNAKMRLPNFDVFEEEIKKEWDKYPVQNKGNAAQLIENLYYLVRGRHQDEIITDTNKREGRYNLVQSGGTRIVNRDEQPKKDPVKDLTDREREVAARMGISAEDYAATKGTLKYA